MRSPAVAYIGLGANLGDAQGTIHAAIAALADIHLTQLGLVSSLYLTAPIDAGGDDYINAVAELHTRLNPQELLVELQALEQQFGRQRSYQNAPRTLDCDLLLYGQQLVDTPTLQVPHPRMHQRAFVLVPLLEIAPHVQILNAGDTQSLLDMASDQVIRKIS